MIMVMKKLMMILSSDLGWKSKKGENNKSTVTKNMLKINKTKDYQITKIQILHLPTTKNLALPVNFEVAVIIINHVAEEVIITKGMVKRGIITIREIIMIREIITVKVDTKNNTESLKFSMSLSIMIPTTGSITVMTQSFLFQW